MTIKQKTSSNTGIPFNTFSWAASDFSIGIAKDGLILWRTPAEGDRLRQYLAAHYTHFETGPRFVLDIGLNTARVRSQDNVRRDGKGAVILNPFALL